MLKYSSHIARLTLMMIVTGLLVIIAQSAIADIMPHFIQLQGGIEPNFWLNRYYRPWVMTGIIFAGCLAIIWYIWATIIETNITSNKFGRWPWLALATLLLPILVIQIFATPGTAGQLLIILSYALLNFSCYWLNTILFSPRGSDWRLAPPLAIYIFDIIDSWLP